MNRTDNYGNLNFGDPKYSGLMADYDSRGRAPQIDEYEQMRQEAYFQSNPDQDHKYGNGPCQLQMSGQHGVQLNSYEPGIPYFQF